MLCHLLVAQRPGCAPVRWPIGRKLDDFNPAHLRPHLATGISTVSSTRDDKVNLCEYMDAI
jgi:hypothetical protein